MKKLFLVLLAVLLIGGVGFAEDDIDRLESICPKTKMKFSCLTCHTKPDFKLKETNPENKYDYPAYADMNIVGDTANLLITTIDADPVQAFFNYILWHPEVKKVVFEIHSPGGSLFDAYKIIGLMQHMKSMGYPIETRCYGFAASAGFLIMASGSHRLVAETSEIMWHELMSFTMFSIETPSDSEEKARVLRHLQDTANGWLATVSNLTIEQINAKIRKREFWMNGKEAVEYGFADGFLK